jgi:hypothetical protein
VATETDAARDRVLAARASLDEELEVLEASARAAVDIPGKIRRNPVRAAAVAGGTGFLVVGGPRRVFRAAKRAVRGPEPELPDALLPDEIEKSLRKLGSDGDKVRGTLERDFAAYAAKAQKERTRWRTLLIFAVARPLVLRGSRAAADWVFRADETGFQARLAQIRRRTAGQVERTAEAEEGGSGATDSGATGSAAARAGSTASEDDAGAAGA